MATMKREPVGVWFSIALIILVLGACAGWMLGSALARYSYRRHQEQQGPLSKLERARVDSELAVLSAVQTEMFHELFALEKSQPPHKYLRDEIGRLENLKLRSDSPAIKSLIDLRQGLAYVRAAMADGENHDEVQAKQNMQSAQALFKSLGWLDYSDETLKAVAKRERDKWTHPEMKGSVR